MILFDSGPLFAYVNDKHPQHEAAHAIFTRSFKGLYGKMVVSNYIVDEVLTLARVRTNRCDCGEAILDLVRARKQSDRIFFEVILDAELVRRTEELYQRYCPKGLSFTDCSLLALVKTLDIEYLATFASEFQGLTAIIDG